MPRIVDKQKKAEAIRGAALEVFRKTGYHRTRMADIARAAGIGKGTLYEYFENKAHILRVAFDQYFDAFRQGAARAMAAATSPVVVPPSLRPIPKTSGTLSAPRTGDDHAATLSRRASEPPMAQVTAASAQS